MQVTNGNVISVWAKLSEPETGTLFFQKQTAPGKAGEYVGFVSFPASRKAYRVEPSGVSGAPELAQQPLDQVVCANLPLPTNSAARQVQAPRPLVESYNDSPVPIPAAQNGIISLESFHGATAVIYLDFQGGYTPSWCGITYERPEVSNAQIRDVWQRVAEDFLPFAINVTTDLQVFQNAPAGSRQHVIITPTTTAAPGQGGVAIIGSFNWTEDLPCWVFSTLGNACAQACSHEAGHSLGLNHDGVEYGGMLHDCYTGHGSGETSWAPIMGLPYYANVTEWSKGEYLHADNSRDELNIISANNNVGYRPDDTGDSLATSRDLEIFPDFTASAQGLIERTDDTDAFQFTTSGGEVSLRADPVSLCPNLALQVALYDENGKLLIRTNTPARLCASLTTTLPQGTYTFCVSGAGRNNPLTNGFSSYASLGYYSVTGKVSNACLRDHFTVNEHSANGTLLGMVRPRSSVSEILSFNIISGNEGNTFAIDNSGALTITDNSLLDYSTLVAQNHQTAQLELFIEITDLADSCVIETNRRVVVLVTPAPASPVIVRQPQGAVLDLGATVLWNVQAIGTAPLRYQWQKDGTNLAGATASSLSLVASTRRDSGMYSVLVSNDFGSAQSSNAVLRVRVPQQLALTKTTDPGQLSLYSFDADGGLFLTSELADLMIQVSQDLVSWQTLTNQFALTNGILIFSDAEARNYRARFYRVLNR